MKKFLSLVLALAMTMSLVTVSAGAKDFTDNSKIDYKEAVDVVSSVGIVDGYEDGAFNPQNTLTRGAAAKIICNLILGPTTASALRADTAPYSDVPTTNNFSGYIAYCQKEGIISGYADGTFKPGASLTGYAFMKMLLGALGYDSSIEGYTGANWSIAVGKRAIGIGLDDGNDNFVGVNAVTREEACLYAFNTMKATMVDYDSKITVDTNDGGSVTVGNNSAYELSNSSKTDGYIKDDGKMQFAEKYFDKLKGVADTDDFGRPATTWKYDGDTIGTYADDADATYVVEDAQKNLSVLVTDSDYLDYSAKDVKDTAKVYRNGKLMGEYADLDDKNTLAGKGDIIEAYENDDNDVATIVVRSYTYAKIDDVDKDLSSSLKNKGASIGVELKDIDGGTIGTYYDNHDDDDKVLNGFDADTYEKDTVLAVAISDKDDTTILDSYVAKSVTGTPTAAREVAKEDKAVDFVTAGDITIDGTKYVYAAQMTGIEAGENVDFDEEYTVYLTAEGYALAIDGAAMATLKDVYYVVGTYGETSRGTTTFYAQAVSVTDGTEHQLKLDANDKTHTAGDLKNLEDEGYKSVGNLFIMDEDDGKYTATTYYGQDGYSVAVATAAQNLTSDMTSSSTAIRFDSGKTTAYNGKSSSDKADGFNNRLYVDDSTFFVSVEDKSEDISIKTATGAMSVDKDTTDLKVFAIYKDGKDDAVFVIYAAPELVGAVNKDDVVYLTDDAKTSVKDGYSVELYFMKDMKNQDVTIDDAGKTTQGFYVYTLDSDGIYKLKSDTTNALTYDTDGTVSDKSDGYATKTFDSVKNNNASSTDNKFIGVSFADATVIDTRTTSAKKADKYSNDITSASRLAAAIDKGEVTADVFVENGEIIFVAVTACENATADDKEPTVDAANYEISHSGLTISMKAYKGTSENDRLAAVEQYIESKIGAIDKETYSGTTYKFTVGNKEYSWDTSATTDCVKVSVDGKDQLMDASKTLNDLNTNGVDSSAKWIKVGKEYQELSSVGSNKIADGTSYETGFYKVAKNALKMSDSDSGTDADKFSAVAMDNDVYLKNGDSFTVTVKVGTQTTTDSTITVSGTGIETVTKDVAAETAVDTKVSFTVTLKGATADIAADGIQAAVENKA